MTTGMQLDRTLHAVLETFVERGYPPHYTELAARFGVGPEEGKKLVHDLAATGLPVWLYPGTDLIASCAPFNAQPTQYRLSGLGVEGGARGDQVGAGIEPHRQPRRREVVDELLPFLRPDAEPRGELRVVRRVSALHERLEDGVERPVELHSGRHRAPPGRSSAAAAASLRRDGVLGWLRASRRRRRGGGPERDRHRARGFEGVVDLAPLRRGEQVPSPRLVEDRAPEGDADVDPRQPALVRRRLRLGGEREPARREPALRQEVADVVADAPAQRREERVARVRPRALRPDDELVAPARRVESRVAPVLHRHRVHGQRSSRSAAPIAAGTAKMARTRRRVQRQSAGSWRGTVRRPPNCTHP